MEEHDLGIGEILEGDELVDSGHHLVFGQNSSVMRTVLCTIPSLSIENLTTFQRAIRDNYWYQLIVDDLPMWGFVGHLVTLGSPIEVQDKFPLGSYVLYTHKHFCLSFDALGHIVHVDLTYNQEGQVLEPNVTYDFTYSMEWIPEQNVSFEDRFDRYLDDDFFKHDIHWFSILNSFMLVIFLVGAVALILFRTLHRDYMKVQMMDDDFVMEGGHHHDGDPLSYSDEPSSILMDGEPSEVGWKLIHGDVFRKPAFFTLHCALMGTGVQLLVLMCLLILSCIAQSLYMEPGGLISTAIGAYALSSFVAGYVSGSRYAQQMYSSSERVEWIKVLVLTVSVFPCTIFFILGSLNWIAVAYGTTYAIPFVTMIQVLALWAFVSFPLAILGTLGGRHVAGKPDVPCRTNKLARRVPTPESWSQRPVVLIALTGILPFGSIFIEMYFILTSFWNYKFYYVYGFVLLVYVILTIVSLCCSIVSTYYLLNAENYHWPWFSFFASGSTAGYVMLYSVYFFLFKTNMTGVLQTMFYMSYMSLFCTALFLLTGTLGVLASAWFVKRIYRDIKSE